MRRAIVAAAVLLAVLTATGCSGSVSGEVSSKTAQKPVPAATVKVGDQQVVTDTSGHFVIDKVKTGTATVDVQAAGFGPHEASLDVQRGENTLNVVLEDGTVAGTLKENAEVREPIKQAKVTIGGKRVSESQGARFSATSVSVGEQMVVVRCPGHAVTKQLITVSPGTNNATITLDLTPEATYMRYYAAYRFKRFAEAYLMLHPDVRKHYSLKAFTKGMKIDQVLSLKLFGTKMLSKWRPSYMHVTYRHVAAIDRAYRYQDAWGTGTDNRTQHWVPAKGRWYIVFDWKL
jgi:hypothetical protein